MRTKKVKQCKTLSLMMESSCSLESPAYPAVARKKRKAPMSCQLDAPTRLGEKHEPAKGNLMRMMAAVLAANRFQIHFNTLEYAKSLG